MRRAAAPLLLLTCLVAGCGQGPAAAPVAQRGPAIVAALGDSITAGSPLWDPSPAVRGQIGPLVNEQSQYEYWAERLLGNYVRFRNCGASGERTDQIAQRLDQCAAGARYLIIQGGLNDIAQGRPVADVAADLRKMVERGKQLGLRVGLAEVLAWNNGGTAAAVSIRELNALIDQIGRDDHVPVYAFYHALEDPLRPGRMKVNWTTDGDHPSVAGYRVLGGLIKLP
jgi:lysophospholipase L1-like esterase